MIGAQVKVLLLEDADVGGLVGGSRVFLTPLKRAGSEDPELAGFPATPDAFEVAPPFFVQRSIVINPAYRVRDTSTRTRTTALARWIVPLAYYAGPDDNEGLELMTQYVGGALDRKWIDVPGGLRGRLVTPHATSTSSDIPEMSGSGVMMLEDIEVAHVTR